MRVEEVLASSEDPASKGSEERVDTDSSSGPSNALDTSSKPPIKAVSDASSKPIQLKSRALTYKHPGMDAFKDSIKLSTSAIIQETRL